MTIHVDLKQVLTGATGALGAHILDQLRARDDVSQVVCLVRAKEAAAARERVSKSLLQRSKRALDVSDGKVICLTAKLGEPNLGLSDADYNDLAARTSTFIHAAWAVNFSMRLRSFVKDHLNGMASFSYSAVSFQIGSDNGRNPQSPRTRASLVSGDTADIHILFLDRQRARSPRTISRSRNCLNRPLVRLLARLLPLQMGRRSRLF